MIFYISIINVLRYNNQLRVLISHKNTFYIDIYTHIHINLYTINKECLSESLKKLVVHLSQKLSRKVSVYVRLMCDYAKRTTMTLGPIGIQFKKNKLF